MEIKVRALEDTEVKSAQEVEAQLLDQHEQSLSVAEEPEVIDPVEEEPKAELREEDVLSYIGQRYGKDINSFDELMAEREVSEDLPDDVANFLKYKKETGRGIDDFVKLNRDLDSTEPDALLRNYLKETEEGLDDEDIEDMMVEYEYDEDLDDENDVKKIKVAKKKILVKAKKHFDEQKEKYRTRLESSGGGSLENTEEYQSYKQHLEQSKSYQEENERRQKWFEEKTDEVFSDKFKGFEFSLNDKSYVFTPGDRTELKKLQQTVENWYGKYLDADTGLVKDAAGYHRSLAVAMNPDKFAQFFYEQGKSEAVDDVMRKTKNINMSERSTPQVASSGEYKVRAVNPDSGRGLKIRSAKRTQ